jgi:UDP-glucose-4-epimerase GalE
VLDNLSTGHDWAVKWGPLVRGDLLDANLLDQLFAQEKPVAVLHFAALTLVGESVREPGKYYLNNVAGTQALLEAMRLHGVSSLIFSSSCATYGMPETLPLIEEHPQLPINTYGRTKLAAEQLIRSYEEAYGLRSVILRYFNAAGADSEGEIGEMHTPETHLIPLAILAALEGRSLDIFGSDYPTPDGTAVRDYIHVHDLAQAHLQALRHLLEGGRSGAFNLGTGRGFSVLEIARAVERVTGRLLHLQWKERRVGDPAILIASHRKFSSQFAWRPQYEGLEPIIQTAYRWHSHLVSQSAPSASCPV